MPGGASVVERGLLDNDAVAVDYDGAGSACQPEVDNGVAAHFFGLLDQVLNGLVAAQHGVLDEHAHALDNLVAHHLGQGGEEFSFDSVFAHLVVI